MTSTSLFSIELLGAMVVVVTEKSRYKQTDTLELKGGEEVSLVACSSPLMGPS